MEQRFWQVYQGQGVKMMAIDADPEDYVQASDVYNFCDTLQITFPAGVEETANYALFTANFAGTNPFPVDIVVDKNGIIRYVAREYDPAGIEAMVQTLLAE
jgi:hypothetical protein